MFNKDQILTLIMFISKLKYLFLFFLLSVIFFYHDASAAVMTMTTFPKAISPNASESSTLTWTSGYNTTSCTASASPVYAGWSGNKSVNGSETVSPTVRTDFILTCTGNDGSTITRTARVNIFNFTANPTTIFNGESSTLNWDYSEGGSKCKASTNRDVNDWKGNKPAVGSQLVSPHHETTIFKLNCEGNERTATVSLLPPTVEFKIDGSDSVTADYGYSATLTWQSTNADFCTASGDWSNNKAVSNLSPGELTSQITIDKIYTLTCTNFGGSTSKTVTAKAGALNHNVSGWIWSENIGWVSVSCDNQGTCSSVDYGVSLNENTGKFSGFGWSENIGWVDFAPVAPYPLAPQTGAILDKITRKVTGWLSALNGSVSSGWDGWVKMTGANYGVTWKGCNLVGWAWGSDVLGWLSFSSKNCDANKDGKADGVVAGCPPAGTSMAQYGVTMDACYNTPPVATAGVVDQSDNLYCTVGTNATFHWTFSDADGDTQKTYQVQVDNNSDFSSPLAGSDDKHNSSSNSFAWPSGQLEYNTTYYWRIKVWDSANPSAESAWSVGQPFPTKEHAYPAIDFNWSPSSPNEITPINCKDKSITYGGSHIDYYLWVFVGGDPFTSTDKDPQVLFKTPGTYTIGHTVQDSNGYTCPYVYKTISVKKSIKWKEITP